MRKTLGILGGMGPLASAEFLKTIYEFNLTDTEQEAPVCILFSDPTFPDRTDAILRSSEGLIIERLVEALEKLGKLGINKVVITCVTIHYFLPKIPGELQEKVISIIDVIVKEVLATKQQHIFLCTNGTRKAETLQRCEQWYLIENYVIFLDQEEQKIIHNYIYKIKKQNPESSIVDCINYLDMLTHKYQVNSFIAGCTEFHLVTKYLMRAKDRNKNYSFVDPLLTVAADLRRLIDA